MDSEQLLKTDPESNQAIPPANQSSFFLQLKQAYKYRKISLRLLGYTVFISTLLTLIITILQLAWEYSQDVEMINSGVDQVESSFAIPISSSIWEVDNEQLSNQLDGILKLPGVQYVAVFEPKSSGSTLIMEKGDPYNQFDIEKRLPLTFDEEEIAALKVGASLSEVYATLANKALFLLVSQGLKTACVSMAFLILVYFIIVRYINQFAHHFDKYSDKAELAHLTLAGKESQHLPEHKQDEIDIMVNAYNKMHKTISTTVKNHHNQRQSLEREELFCEAIASRSQDLFIKLDTRFVILDVNESTLSFLNIGKIHCLGITWEDLFVEPNEKAKTSRFLRQQKDQSFQFSCPCRNSNTQPVELQWEFIYLPGQYGSYWLAKGVSPLKNLSSQAAESDIKQSHPA